WCRSGARLRDRDGVGGRWWIAAGPAPRVGRARRHRAGRGGAGAAASDGRPVGGRPGRFEGDPARPAHHRSCRRHRARPRTGACTDRPSRAGREDGVTVVIGTAGHIDHGKTTLLRALTGIDADRLPEERARGMTIDVGYAHLTLDDGTELDFVDVPGHDRLVGNMLVGAGEIDAALVV